MSDLVRIVLRTDDGGAYTVSGARGVPDQLGDRVQPFRSADVVLDGSDAVAPADDAEVLEFTMMAPSPLGADALRDPSDALLAFAYHAHDEAVMLAFDERITDEYTAYYATRGVRYSGVYRAEGLGLNCLGEILAFAGVHSAEEGEKRGSEDLSPRIVEIEDECRTYQDREAPRFALWLLPSGGA